jgi:VanZ family protein
MVNLRAIQFAAWASLVVVALAALVPIELRPASSLPPTIERFGAFAAVGFAFALAYPRQFWLAVLIVAGAAMLFEVMQVLAPSRHGRLADAMVKLSGGVAGLIVGWMLLWWEARRTRAVGRSQDEAA